jgi:hypothetical protein
MFFKRVLYIYFATIVFISSASVAEVTTGSIFLRADSDSFIGGGIGEPEVLWTHGDEGLFSISTNFNKGASVTFDDGDNWSFDFAAPKFNSETNEESGNLLEVKFYDEATRFPFNSPTKPGLSFSGNGRGNNKLGGSFNVLEIEYDEDEEIQRLAVDFRQYDGNEDATGPSTFGSLRINSTIPINTTGNVQSSGEAPESQNASFTIETKILELPVVIVGDSKVSARLLFEQIGNESQLVLQETNPTEETSDSAASFAADTGIVTIPVVGVFSNGSKVKDVSATMTVIGGSVPLRFVLTNIGDPAQ